MHIPTKPWNSSLVVPVTVDTERFFAHSSRTADKVLKIQPFNDPNALISGAIDIDSFKITTFLNDRVKIIKPNSENLSHTFDCPMDAEPGKDCIQASANWVSHEDKSYKVEMITEIPVSELVNWVALGLQGLQEKNWKNCFALNQLKAIHMIFDRSMGENQKIGSFRLGNEKPLEIEPIYPLLMGKRRGIEGNADLMVTSLVNASYMQPHPQEYLYFRTCYQVTADSSDFEPKNKSLIKYPNGAKVTQYV